MQWLVSSTFRRLIHRPSLLKEWQMPPNAPFPIPPLCAGLSEPYEEQEESYFAASDKISSFSSKIIRGF